MTTDGWMKLDKTAFGIASLQEPSDERYYWHARTPEQRLLALEQMRQIIYGYRQPAPRLQRILELTQLERG